MSYWATADLEQLSDAQAGKADTANDLLAALSSAALFAVKSVAGLVVTLYGGNYFISGVPTAIANQSFTATDNDTSYIYATSSAVVTKTLVTPAWWPGPGSSGEIALYEIVAVDGVLDYDACVCYVPSLGMPGDQGVPGEQGPAGSDFFLTRKRIAMARGAGSTVIDTLGHEPLTVTSATARSVSTSSFREAIPYVATVSAGSAGSSAQLYANRNAWTLGNAARVGGFNVTIRWCHEHGALSSPANQRCFIGLAAPTAFGNVEPDTFVNIIGVGAKAGEANLSLLYNDAAGTATKTLIVSDDSPSVNFPARANNNVYELTLSADPFGSTVDWLLEDCETGVRASGTINSNLPGTTTFVNFVLWVNNGSTAAQCSLGFMQCVGESRY